LRRRQRQRAIAQHRLAAELVYEEAIGIDEPAESPREDAAIGSHGLPVIDAERLACRLVHVPAEAEGPGALADPMQEPAQMSPAHPVVVGGVGDEPAACEGDTYCV